MLRWFLQKRLHAFSQTTDLKEIAKKVAELPKANPKRPRLVIFTHGLEPAIAYQDGVVRRTSHSAFSLLLFQYTAVPAQKIDPAKIVDTNGAGDSFVGGFLAQCTCLAVPLHASKYLDADIQHKPLVTCMKAGHYVASQVIQVSGVVYNGKPDFQDQ
jgi:adenosine kinase